MQATLQGPKKERAFQLEKQALSPRRRLRQRSRNTLLIALISFVLLQGTLRVLIDSVLPEFRDPHFEIKARHLEKILSGYSAKPYTIIMMGSSVTGSGFDAGFLEEQLTRELGKPFVVFNMSSLGSGPLTNLVWVRRLLQRGLRPDLVLIELTPQQYNAPGVPVDAARFPACHLESAELELVAQFTRQPNYRWEWWQARLVPSYGHRLAMLNYLARTLVPEQDRLVLWTGYDERCFHKPKGFSPQEHQHILARVEKSWGESLKDFNPGSLSVQALNELLDLLQQEKIQAGIVYMPLGPTLRRQFPPDRLQKFVKATVATTQAKNGWFLDAYAWLDEPSFTDGFHINSEGAEHFSRRLCAEFLVPHLRNHLTVPRQ